MKSIIRAILLLLALQGAAWGANCGGGTACACGDTITSSYTLPANLSCSSGTFALTIGADSVVLDLGGYTISDTASIASGIVLTDKDSVEIKNGTITGFDTQGILLDGGSSNKINNLTIHTNGTIGISVRGDATYPANSNLIYSNTIYDNPIAGIYLNDDNGTLTVAANLNNNQIYSNLIYHNGNNIQISRSLDTLVYSNTVHTAYTAGGGEGDGIAVTSSPRTKVYRNTVYSNANIGIHVYGDVLYDANYGEGHNCEVYGNVVYGQTGTDDAGISFLSDEVDGLSIRYNLLYNNYNGFKIAGKSTSVLIANNTVNGGTISLIILDNLNAPADNSATGVTLTNNIFLGASLYGLADSTVSGTAALAAHTYNLYRFTCVQYSNWLIDYAGTSYACMDNVAAFEATALTADPLLTATYSIENNSPAKDAGVAIAGIHSGSSITGGDAAGNTWLYGSGIDIGAYEIWQGHFQHMFGFTQPIPKIYTIP